MTIETLKVRYSGGASNSDSSASIGGSMSSVEVVSATFSNTTPVSGITLLDCTGQPDGEITVTLVYDTLYGLFIAYAENVAGTMTMTSRFAYNAADPDDRFTLHFGFPHYGTLVMAINAAQLPSAVDGEVFSGTTEVTNVPDNLFPEVTAQNMSNNESVYRCIYLKSGANTVYDISAFVPVQPSEQNTYAVAFDPMANGGTAIQLADELDSTNLLSALTFLSPNESSQGVSKGTLGTNSHVALWIRRTTSPDAPNNGGKETAVYGVGYRV